MVATNTPQFGEHTKYCFPPTDPSFFPLPEKPPLSSTPAHRPDLPSISPIYLKQPSNPKDSILTLSPTSNVFPARLTLRVKTSDCLLGARGAGVFVLLCENAEVEATEEGRPVTERRPDCNGAKHDFGEDDEGEVFEVVLVRCCAGSLALIAFANARDINSTSESKAG